MMQQQQQAVYPTAFPGAGVAPLETMYQHQAGFGMTSPQTYITFQAPSDVLASWNPMAAFSYGHPAAFYPHSTHVSPQFSTGMYYAPVPGPVGEKYLPVPPTLPSPDPWTCAGASGMPHFGSQYGVPCYSSYGLLPDTTTTCSQVPVPVEQVYRFGAGFSHPSDSSGYKTPNNSSASPDDGMCTLHPSGPLHVLMQGNNQPLMLHQQNAPMPTQQGPVHFPLRFQQFHAGPQSSSLMTHPAPQFTTTPHLNCVQPLQQSVPQHHPLQQDFSSDPHLVENPVTNQTTMFQHYKTRLSLPLPWRTNLPNKKSTGPVTKKLFLFSSGEPLQPLKTPSTSSQTTGGSSNQHQQHSVRRKIVYSNNILYKTSLCKDFEAHSGSFCPRGEQCQFAHGSADLHVPSRHQLYHTKMCPEMQRQGNCSRNVEGRCYHAHSRDELRAALHPTKGQQHHKNQVEPPSASKEDDRQVAAADDGQV